MKERRDFDAAAAAWDEKPQRITLGREIAAAIAGSLPLSRTWNAMDFGCGTGLVTLNLAPLVGSILGVDSSEKMVELLNAKAARQGCSNARALRLDLERGELPRGRFDLITSSMTLHHIPELVPLLAALRPLLTPGGRVALADLETEDGTFHEEQLGVFHLGFSRELFTELLSLAGFRDISMFTVTAVTRGERSYPVFLATASAP